MGSCLSPVYEISIHCKVIFPGYIVISADFHVVPHMTEICILIYVTLCK